MWQASFKDELQKTAIIGPFVDLNFFGIPSIAGYQLGKTQGMHQAKLGLDPPGERTGADWAGLAFIPGAFGYQLGARKGYDVTYSKG